MNPAIFCISGSFMPRVVTAGVPTRIPDVTKGLCVSNGMEFLLTVICALSRTVAASFPVTLTGRRSTSIMWLSVPPDTIRRPAFSNAAAITFAFFTICAAYSLNAG